MLLSPAAASELEAVVRLINQAYRGREGWTSEADYLDGERITVQALRAELKARPAGRVLALREAAGGPILGCVWLEPFGEGRFGLGLVAVRPDLQARKLGRELLERAERHARACGARRVKITVVNVREELIAWYERRGYRRTGQIEPFPYGDLRFGAPQRDDLAFVVLEKSLADPAAEAADGEDRARQARSG
jgi:GNAT superfamily N-acetyltransferase